MDETPCDRAKRLVPQWQGGSGAPPAGTVGACVKRAVAEPFRIAHATFELECEQCVDDGSWCAMGEITPEVYETGRLHEH